MSLYIGGPNRGLDIDNILIGSNGIIKNAKEVYIGDMYSKPQLIYEKVDVEKDLLKENPISLLKSGKLNRNYVGRTVYLTNSETSCREWIIIGYNHETNDGSIDLISKYAIIDSIDYDRTSRAHNEDINAKEWIMKPFSEGFDPKVMDIMHDMYFKSDSFAYGIVKIPSAIELGISCSKNEPSNDGTTYSYFGNGLVSTNSKAILKNSSNSPVKYWTRRNYYDGSKRMVTCIDSTGTACAVDVNLKSANKAALRAIIRITPRTKMKESVDELLTKVNPADLLASGRISKNDIGKTVYLSSNIDSQEWVIADVDHDGIEGSVDLVCKYTSGYKNTIDGFYEYYGSNMRSDIQENDIAYSFTDEINRSLMAFNIASGNYILKDLVKLLSTTELGIQPPIESVGEGSIYPVFGDTLRQSNNLAARLNSSSEPVNYWTRTCCNPSNVLIDTNGNPVILDAYDDAEDTVLAIRFKKPNRYESKDEMMLHADNAMIFKKGVLNAEDIGKTVILTNTNVSCGFNKEWIIADINHDGTEDTVDLICSECIDVSDIGLVDNDYPNSEIRQCLNEEFMNSFSPSIKPLLTECGCYYNGEDLGDKVKLISYEELGMQVDECTNCGTNSYPIFNYVDGAEINESCMCLDFWKDPMEYYVRNDSTAGESYAGVDADGNPTYLDRWDYYLMICIRIQCYD